MENYRNVSELPVIAEVTLEPCHLTPAERSARRAAFSLDDVERGAVLLCAELANLQLDRDIWRGDPLPETWCGLALSLTGEQASPDGADYRECFFLLSGQDSDASRIRRRMALIRSRLLETPWVSVQSRRMASAVIFASWRAEKTEFSLLSSGGKICRAGKTALTATLCVTPPEPE